MIYKMVTVGFLLFSVSSAALPVHNFEPTASVCANIDEEVNKATSRLRSEHSIREGAYLKQRLQDLRQMRIACQNAEFKTHPAD
ncbi:hypothetical protein [Salinimonas lutimaris]|uniref:hypothetical protein n=1 Tax=Salinimonas lutimaris TaxID=914153 RepID=UPI0010C045A7|nr:hypothetical protein [Salinimonas lutimaris]